METPEGGGGIAELRSFGIEPGPRLNLNPTKSVGDPCNFVHPALWFPLGESLGRAKTLHRRRGKMRRRGSVRGGEVGLGEGGMKAGSQMLPAEQVEQPLPAGIRCGGLGLVFLCR